MIGKVCAYIHNFFETDEMTGQRLIYPGIYTIEGGNIDLPFLEAGQYFRMLHSRFNNGVHVYGVDELKDETFDGVIWEMRPPQEFLALVDEITAWVEKYGETANSPFQSENVIGVYNYTKGEGGGSWPSVFKERLKPYRKLCF